MDSEILLNYWNFKDLYTIDIENELIPKKLSSLLLPINLLMKIIL